MGILLQFTHHVNIYNALKFYLLCILQDDLDRLKGSLKELRDKRDQLFKERGELKRKEDDAKNEMRYEKYLITAT